MPRENVGVVEGDGDLNQPLIYFLWAISNKTQGGKQKTSILGTLYHSSCNFLNELCI